MSKFNSQVCTSVEQSKRLLELGLNPETADCQHLAYTTDSKGKPIPKRNQKWFTRIGINKSVPVCGFMSATFIPAWSLHRLIEMCNKNPIGMTISIYNDEVTVDGDLFEVLDNTYDNLISVIEWLIKGGRFNKEYLKQ